jgi:hypothetical protein
MSDLYSTVPQKEIQAAVGAVISLAKHRELLRDGASCWESGGKGGKSETATREISQVAVFLWALKGLNLRLPPCEDDERAFPPVTAA